MGKCFGVELGWTSAARETLVASTDARSKFVAYQAHEEVPDEDVPKVDRAIKPVGAKQAHQIANKQRPKPPNKGGLSISEGEA